MKKIKIGIMGLGKMGLFHQKAYDKIEDVEIIGRHDINGNFDTKEKFMSNVLDMDGISICTNNDSHVKNALDILKINPNIKILIEKPISNYSKESKGLLSFSDNIMVGHIERWNPLIQKIKAMIESGKISQIHSIMTKRNCFYTPSYKNTDVAKDLLIHDIDVINYISKEKPSKWKVIYKQSGEYLDRSYIFGMYDSFVFYSEASWVLPARDRRIILNTAEGVFEGNYITKELICKTLEGEREIRVDKKDSLLEEIKSFIEMIINNTYSPCSIQDAILALEVVSKEKKYEL